MWKQSDAPFVTVLPEPNNHHRLFQTGAVVRSRPPGRVKQAEVAEMIAVPQIIDVSLRRMQLLSGMKASETKNSGAALKG